jgi:hypothetical protein
MNHTFPVSEIIRLAFWLLVLVLVPAAGSAREIVGWVEHARIYPGDMELKARVDTGARMSSLGIEFYEYFQHGNETWVRFSVTNYRGETLTLERKLQRIARIKREPGIKKERPVIRIGICFAGIYQEIEANLEDRGHMIYPMLVGRDFLDGHFLVDPNARFINPPHCKREKMQDERQ